MLAKIDSDSVMNIRRYQPSDREAVLELRKKHDESLWFADPDDPVNFETYLIEVDGKLVGCITGRITIEGFIMLDKSFGAPIDRLAIANELVQYGRYRAGQLNIPEVHIGVMQHHKGWLRKLMEMEGVFKDDRQHLVMSAKVATEE